MAMALLKTDAQPVPKDYNGHIFCWKNQHSLRSHYLTGPRFQDITAQWHPLNLALQRKVGTYRLTETQSNMKT
jgi:hypothetical protein